MRVHERFRAASRELKQTVVALSGVYPGAVAYVADPATADWLGLSVTAVLDGLAVGLLTDDDGEDHVMWWRKMLRRRTEFDDQIRTDGLPDPIPAVSFLLLNEANGASPERVTTGNWRGIRAFRGFN